MFLKVQDGKLINLNNVISFIYSNEGDDINKFTIEAIIKDAESLFIQEASKYNNITVCIAENINKKQLEEFFNKINVISI